MEARELCYPELLNASCRRSPRPHFETLLIYALLSVVSLLTVVLNLLVVVSISHFRQLHTPSNLLLLSLAVSDLLVGVLMLLQAMLIDGCWFLGDVLCTLYQCLAYVVTSASLATVVAIAVDRYVAVCCPLQYSGRVTRRRVRVCVCLCWAGAVLLQCLNLADSVRPPDGFAACAGRCVVLTRSAAALADVLLSFAAPIVIIVLLYLRVFAVALAQARAMRPRLGLTGPRTVGGVVAKKSELKAARALGLVILLFFASMCPYYCITLLQDDALNSPLGGSVVFLFYFNSSLNPAIYAFFYPWFRRSVRLIVTLQILKPKSCNANVL